jgi:hypothetical protein
MIPKRKSEAVNEKVTDNTMAIRKRTKGQTIIYKTLTQKSKTRVKGQQFLLH